MGRICDVHCFIAIYDTECVVSYNKLVNLNFHLSGSALRNGSELVLIHLLYGVSFTEMSHHH